jgi:hypothetical protein
VTRPEQSVSRESEAAAKRKDTAEASMTRCWCHMNMEVPMPLVHNGKSKAKDIHDGGPKGRGRRAIRACSCFVLLALGALGAGVGGAVGVQVGDFSVAITLPTVNSPEQSVSRESEAAAKRKDTAEASMTRCWCQFQRA